MEHPTATSLLPLRCFQVVHIPRLHTQIKSNHQGRVSLASAKPDPPSGARRGNPLCVKNFLGKSLSARTSFTLFDCFDSKILKMTRVHVSGKADRAEGLLRLRDTDTSLITFREKQLSLAQTILLPTKKSRYSKQEEKKRSFTTRRGCVWASAAAENAHYKIIRPCRLGF